MQLMKATVEGEGQRSVSRVLLSLFHSLSLSLFDIPPYTHSRPLSLSVVQK
jgi:hypothetical protein